MSIDIDPQSLKSLAEDIDIANNKTKKVIEDNKKSFYLQMSSLTLQMSSLKDSLISLINSATVKQITAVFVNGSLPRGNSTYSHDLGATPSSAGASCSGTDGSGSTPDITVVGYTSTTVTVYCPSANNKNAVIILKR